MKMSLASLSLALLLLTSANAQVQSRPPSPQEQAAAEKAFEEGNAFMEQKKFSQALARYKAALATLPDEPAILYNAGMAAYSSKDYGTALDWWKQLKALEPADWRLRAKLIQVYQALGRLPERDTERAALFEMWKNGQPPELQQEFEYCRDQFEVKGKKVMAFEHFELKGDRALRYVFSIVNEAGDDEEYRISLGSYELTNAVWRETKNPKPKEGERLFHLDGYFKNGHATYGMFSPEPSFDQVREMVIKILEGKDKPLSSSVFSTEKKVPAKPEP